MRTQRRTHAHSHWQSIHSVRASSMVGRAGVGLLLHDGALSNVERVLLLLFLQNLHTLTRLTPGVFSLKILIIFSSEKLSMMKRHRPSETWLATQPPVALLARACRVLAKAHVVCSDMAPYLSTWMRGGSCPSATCGADAQPPHTAMYTITFH